MMFRNFLTPTSARPPQSSQTVSAPPAASQPQASSSTPSVTAVPTPRGPSRPPRSEQASSAISRPAQRRRLAAPRAAGLSLVVGRPQPAVPATAPTGRTTRQRQAEGGDYALRSLLDLAEQQPQLQKLSPDQHAVAMVDISGQIHALYPELMSLTTLRVILSHERGLEMLEQSASKAAELPFLALGEERIANMIENEDGQMYLMILHNSDTLLRNSFVGGLLVELTQERTPEKKFEFLIERLDALGELGVWATDALKLVARPAGPLTVQAVMDLLPRLRERDFVTSDVLSVAVKAKASAEAVLLSMDATLDELQSQGHTRDHIVDVISAAPYAYVLPMLAKHTPQMLKLGYTLEQIREISSHGGTDTNFLIIIDTTEALRGLDVQPADIVGIIKRRHTAVSLPKMVAHGGVLKERGSFSGRQLCAFATTAKSNETFEVAATYVSAFESGSISAEQFIKEMKKHDSDRLVKIAKELLRPIDSDHRR